MISNPPLVLVCPLDWGLGHASRMIPVIEKYGSEGYRVMIGGSGKSGVLLKQTFPSLHFLDIPSSPIRYSGKGLWPVLSLLGQLPKMIRSAIREHHWIAEAVTLHNIAIVVSDNRYGLFCRKAHTIFVTHQLSPILPLLLRWFEYPLYRIIQQIILQYNECWIPDVADPQHNLSGILSHRFKLPRNARFIGVLSRFSGLKNEVLNGISETFDLVVVISGPEPQAGLILRFFLRQLSDLPDKTLIICGNPGVPTSDNLNQGSGPVVVPHLQTDQFARVLQKAKSIICRSGYSGIMDCITLGKTAMLIPTPGQTEQLYLAGYLARNGQFEYCKQSKLDLKKIIKYVETSIPDLQISGSDAVTVLPVEHLSHAKNDYHNRKSQEESCQNLK